LCFYVSLPLSNQMNDRCTYTNGTSSYITLSIRFGSQYLFYDLCSSWVFFAPKDFFIFLHFLAFKCSGFARPDEYYSRNESCALNLLSTVLS